MFDIENCMLLPYTFSQLNTVHRPRECMRRPDGSEHGAEWTGRMNDEKNPIMRINRNIPFVHILVSFPVSVCPLTRRPMNSLR